MIFSWVNGRVVINAKLAIKFLTQHGVPLEVFESWVNSAFPPKSYQRAILIARAYDLVHATRWEQALNLALKL